MKRLSTWLLGGIGAALVLTSAAIAGDKPETSKWQALPYFMQLTEIAVSAEETPSRCPCCNIMVPTLQASCEAPLWYLASHWLKPLALGCQFAPFLGYVDVDVDADPQIIVAEFIRTVTQGECVQASCPNCPNCPVSAVTACTAECKCTAGKKCACAGSVTCTADGKCCAGVCACKECACSKNCVCPTAKCGECCGECKCSKGYPCAQGKCPVCGNACENCPPTAVWMWTRHPLPPMPPPAFGGCWGPMAMPCPGPDMPGMAVQMPLLPPGMIPPGNIPGHPMPGHPMPGHPMPMHPMAQWHPNFPRILPPVVEEQSDCQVAQTPVAPPVMKFQAVSRAVRRPTPIQTAAVAAQPVGTGNRVQYSTANFEATCDRLSYLGNVVVLQGNVQLTLCNNPHAGRISAECVEVNTETGAFTVNGQGTTVHSTPVTNYGVVPTSCKPDTNCAPTTRPVQR